jgi:tRNA A37 N6-isopentenylltransferase MiaA
LSRIKRHTRRFVRHQYNWFRLDEDVPTKLAFRWFDVLSDPYEEIRELVISFLEAAHSLSENSGSG